MREIYSKAVIVTSKAGSQSDMYALMRKHQLIINYCIAKKFGLANALYFHSITKILGTGSIDRRTGTNFAPRKREMCIYV